MASRKATIEIVGELKAIRGALEEQNRITRARTTIESKHAVRALADALSGEIAGESLRGRRSAGNGPTAIID